MSLTVAFVSARDEPLFQWFADSLDRQCNDTLDVIWINADTDVPTVFIHGKLIVLHHPPKPNIWQGKHRITKEDWWAKASALNTAIALCRTDYVAFVDDRCVLGPNWMKAVKKSMKENYAVCGSYEKRVGMSVTEGKIVSSGTIIGKDHRTKIKRPSYFPTFGHDWFGCTNALPVEWALKVNGYCESLCDGLGYEDTAFGRLLANNSFHVQFDPAMLVIQDRTPGQCEPTMRREDVGKSPNDKSHALVTKIDGMKTSGNSYDLRALRNSVISGQPFPPPTASQTEWFTGELITDFQERKFP